jgi:hypothetical protein
MLLVERSKIVNGGIGLANAGGLAGDRISLKDYNHLTVIVDIAPASGTDPATITLKQSKTVDDSPSTEKALAFTRAWKNADVSQSDTLVKTGYSSSIATSAEAKHEQFVLELDAAELDVENGYDCVRADVTDPGSVSTPCAMTYILSEPRYANATPPSAIVD